MQDKQPKSGVWQPLPIANKMARNRRGRVKKKKKRRGAQRECEELWVTYAEYLRTKWWRRRRKRAVRLAGWKCERCGRRERLQVHHKTYRNLGRELDSDLEALCDVCHRMQHAAVIEQNTHLDAIAGHG